MSTAPPHTRGQTPPPMTRRNTPGSTGRRPEPRNGHPKRIHLLEHHLADVGACFEALMRQPTIRKRLATTGGLDDLDESLVARLSALAALHDIGKVNMGLQARIWRSEDLPGGRRPMHFTASATLWT